MLLVGWRGLLSAAAFAAATAAASTAPTATESTLVLAAKNRDLHPAAQRADVADDHAITTGQTRKHFRLARALVDHTKRHARDIDHAIGDAVDERRSVLLRLPYRRHRHDESVGYRLLHDTTRRERATLERAVTIL